MAVTFALVFGNGFWFSCGLPKRRSDFAHHNLGTNHTVVIIVIIINNVDIIEAIYVSICLIFGRSAFN